MKTRYLVLPLVLMCAACSDQGGEAPAPVATSPEAAAPGTPPPAAVAPQPTPADLYAKLPDSGLRFDFEFTPRTDKLVDAGDGVIRRGISIQYLQPAGLDIQQSVDASLTSAGYVANAEWQTNENGGSSRTFAKDNAAPLTLTIVPDAGTPSAGGVIWIGWRVKKTAAAGT